MSTVNRKYTGNSICRWNVSKIGCFHLANKNRISIGSELSLCEEESCPVLKEEQEYDHDHDLCDDI